jgi:rubrerythrin
LICCNCVTELDQAYQFKEKSVKSESALLDIIGRPVVEEIFVKNEPDYPPIDVATTENTKFNDPPTLSEAMINVKDDEIEADEPAKRTSLKTDEKIMFACDICSKTFKNSSSLKTHLYKMHNKAKRFICNECGALFAAKSKCYNHFW